AYTTLFRSDFDEQRVRIHGERARRSVDVLKDVLLHRGPRPEELARGRVERVDDAGLAGNARDDLASLAVANARIDPSDLGAIGRDGRLDDEPLERMIEIP